MPDRVRMLVVAVALDAIAGEVGGAWHPVAVASQLLEAAYEPWWRRPPLVELGGGAVSLTGVAVAVAALGRGAERLAAPGRPGMLIAGAALKQTLSIRCLLEEGSSVAAALERDRLEDARLRLRALVSRPTAELDAALLSVRGDPVSGREPRRLRRRAAAPPRAARPAGRGRLPRRQHG